MAFTVNFYTFSKDENSTKRPGSPARSYNCTLKDASGVISPAIQLNIGNTDNPTALNYAYIPAWSRYYFVQEWYYDHGLWIAQLAEDCLATWREEIAATTAYIYRTSAAYDDLITDDLYPAYANSVTLGTAASSYPFQEYLSAGRYVVGIVNNSSNAVGAVGYYVFTESQFRTFCNKLMQNTQWLNIPTDVTQGGLDDNLLKALFNPFQYVVSCKWFPYQIPVGSAISAVPYGWWTLSGVSCYNLPAESVDYKLVEFPITKHPQTATRGRYLNGAPFTKLSLDFQPFGVVPLDASLFITKDKVYTSVAVDLITGEAILSIKNGTEALIDATSSTHHAQLGVDIQLAQIAVDRLTQAETVITGAAATARDTLGAVSTGFNVKNLINPISGGLDTAAQGQQAIITGTHAIADGIRASMPSVQIGGSQGSFAPFSYIPRLITQFYNITDEDNANEGRPYCKVGSPATLGLGFYQFRRGDVDMAGNSMEKSIVSSFLVSGFKYE